MKLPISRIYLCLALLILAVSFFQFYVFLRLSRDKRSTAEQHTVRDYERVLCSFIKPRKVVNARNVWCPQQGIITTFKHGTLSKNMWQYASVIALSLTTGLDPYIPGCLLDSLEEVFTNVSVPTLAEISDCYVPLPASATSLDDWTDVQQSIVVSSYDLVSDTVAENIFYIRENFVFTPHLKQVAQDLLVLAQERTSNATDTVFVGAYITNTDIIVNQEYDDVYPNVQFFLNAVNHFRMKFSNLAFVVISDRKYFWKHTLSNNVYVIDEKTLLPGVALAVLAHCNHSILSSDDFSVWAAIFTRGTTIVSLSLSEDLNGLIQKFKWTYALNNTSSQNKSLTGSSE